MNKIWVSLMIGLLVLAGCKKELRQPKSVGEKVGIESFDFEYLVSKAKFKYENGDQKIGVTANFRLKKDSAIWVSLTPGLGIEAARLLVTKEGVQMMDKLKRDYYSYNFETLTKMYGFEMSYAFAEALVVGNVLFAPEKKKELINDGRFNSFTKEENGFGISHFVGRNTGKLERLHAYEINSNNSIVVNYADFEKFGDQRAPQKIRARVKFQDETKSDIVIDIEYSKTSISEEPLTFPFNVPDKYSYK